MGVLSVLAIVINSKDAFNFDKNANEVIYANTRLTF